MDKEITLASPYPWEDEEMEKSLKASDKLLLGKPFVGSGFTSLQKQLGPNSQLNATAKSLLMNLLDEHNVKLGDNGDDSEPNAETLYGMDVTGLQREPLMQGTPEDETLQMARDGKLSLFSSLLNVVDTSDPPVATKTLIRKCCLAVKPGDLPGTIDSKDIVLAALHFLSSGFESGSEDRYPSLPLIRPILLTGDLEKRNYEKVGDWNLDDIQKSVNNLEQTFVRSSSSWKWLRREAFSPHLSQDDETSFFLKGTIPVSASAKKAKGDSGRKRKSSSPVPSSPVPSSVPSPVPSELLESLSPTPAMEGTIVADDGGDE
jgi:hypothetical protein